MMKRLSWRLLALVLLWLAVFALATLVPLEQRERGVTPGYGRLEDSRQVIRFRVIAASDRPEDQRLKLRVRDQVLELLRPELKQARSRQEAAGIIARHLVEIRSLAGQTLRQEGDNHQVQVTWGVTDFPAKIYGPLVFPPGEYQALKIVIGPGEGRNWWCVLYPPLCYVDLAGSAPEARPGSSLSDRSHPAAASRGEAPLLTTRIGSWLQASARGWLTWRCSH